MASKLYTNVYYVCLEGRKWIVRHERCAKPLTVMSGPYHSYTKAHEVVKQKREDNVV